MTNEEMLLRVMLGEMEIPETFQPQTNKQAYLAYGLGIITDFDLLPLPRTNEELLLYKLAEEGFGGGIEYVEFPTELTEGINLASGKPYSFLVDKETALFSAPNAGLWCFSDGEFKQILPEGTFQDFYEAKNGVFLPGSSAFPGLYYFDKTTHNLLCLYDAGYEYDIYHDTSAGWFISCSDRAVRSLRYVEGESTAEVIWDDNFPYNLSGCVELEKGVLLGSGLAHASSGGLIYYDIEAGIGTKIAPGNAGVHNSLDKVAGGAVVRTGEGVLHFDEDTKTLSETGLAEFMKFAYKVPGGLIMTSYIPGTGVAFYDEVAKTSFMILEGSYPNFSNFAEVEDGVFMSCTSYSIYGILFFDFATKSCVQVSTEGYNYRLAAKVDAGHILAANSGLYLLDISTQQRAALVSSGTFTSFTKVANGLLAQSSSGTYYYSNDTGKATKKGASASYVVDALGNGKYALSAQTSGGGLYIFDEDTEAATAVQYVNPGSPSGSSFDKCVPVGDRWIATYQGGYTGAFDKQTLTAEYISRLGIYRPDTVYDDGVLVVTTSNKEQIEVCFNKETLEVTERVKLAPLTIASGGVFCA